MMGARTGFSFARANPPAVGFDHPQFGNVFDFNGKLFLRVQRDALLLLFAQFAARFVGQAVYLPRTDFDFAQHGQRMFGPRIRMRFRRRQDDPVARVRAERLPVQAGDVTHREKKTADICGSKT
jgi:hypothetical protein